MSDKAKHKQGKWMLDPKAATTRAPYEIFANGSRIALLYMDGDAEEVRANAALIAAAPDMLAALKTVDKWLMDGFDKADEASSSLHPAFRKALKQVRAAIALAEGGTCEQR